MARMLPQILIGALVLAACSSDSSPSTQTTSPTADATTIDMSDYRFAPATITLTEGLPAELNLRNSGSVVHNWTVLADEITTETDFDEALVLFRGEAVAGAQNRLTFEPPAAGVYQVICTVATHFSQGMEGRLIVESR